MADEWKNKSLEFLAHAEASQTYVIFRKRSLVHSDDNIGLKVLHAQIT